MAVVFADPAFFFLSHQPFFYRTQKYNLETSLTGWKCGNKGGGYDNCIFYFNVGA